MASPGSVSNPPRCAQTRLPDPRALTDDQGRFELAAHEGRAAALVKCMDDLRLSRAVRRRPAYDVWIFELEEAVRSAFRNQPSGEDHYELVLANPDSLDAACWAFAGLMTAILDGWDVFVRSQFNRAQRRAFAFRRRQQRPISDEAGRLHLGDLVDDTGPPGHIASVSPTAAHAPPASRQDVPKSTTAAVALAA